VITAVGSASAPWVITRAADADNNPAGELANGDFVFVTSGSTNGSKGFILNTTGTITIGTTEVAYAQFNASEAVIAGTNISKVGETISVVSNPTFANVVTVSAGVKFSDNTIQTSAGVPSLTQFIQKTSSYTLNDLTLIDEVIEVDSSSATTITIPTNATLAWPVGASVDILQIGTGQVTIAAAGGVTLNFTPGNKLRTRWSSCTIMKRGTDSWILYGDLTA
jgi:ribosomal protein L24